jgi:lipoprotein-anchoring transpeptidase ErfK/SrfK
MLVAQGINAARAGRRHEAIELFDQVLRLEENLEALIWRGGLSNPDDALVYLERASRIDARDQRVREGIAWARQRANADVRHGWRRRPATSAPARITLALARLRLPMVALVVVLVLGILAAVALARVTANQDGATALAAEQPIVATATIEPEIPVLVPLSPAAAATMPAPSPTIAPSPTPSPTPTPDPSALDLAWKAEDWPQVIALVEGMLAAAPDDRVLTEKLFSAYFNYGVQLVRAERLAEGVAAFDKALTISPGDPRAVGEHKFAQLYLQGATALNANDLAAAITPLRTIFDGNPNYRSVKSWLYQAYVGQAAALETAGKKTDAYLAFEKAAKVDSKGEEAQAGLTRLKASAPASSPAGKKIEVDIAKQQVTAWQDGKAVYVFKASTGKAPYLTRKGNFTILSKMPNAYSSSMGWGMPWWMGIYYAGKWENGFHAMARLRNGTVMPNSSLGRPQTHGCIMLSDANAKTLYDWAVIGTAVWIH